MWGQHRWWIVVGLMLEGATTTTTTSGKLLPKTVVAENNGVYADDDNFVAPDQPQRSAGAETGSRTRRGGFRKKRSGSPALGATRPGVADWRALEGASKDAIAVYAWRPGSDTRALPADGSLALDATTGRSAAGAPVVLVSVLARVDVEDVSVRASGAILSPKRAARRLAPGKTLTVGAVGDGPAEVSVKYTYKGQRGVKRVSIEPSRRERESVCDASAEARLAWLFPPLLEGKKRPLTTAIVVTKDEVRCGPDGSISLVLDRTALGIVAQIKKNGVDVLSRGARIDVREAPECRRTKDELVDYGEFLTWTWRAECGRDLELELTAKIIRREARIVCRFRLVRGPAVSWRVSHALRDAAYAAGAGASSGSMENPPLDWSWQPSRPLDGFKGSPPGMGAPGSCWDQFVWSGSAKAGLKLRLMSSTDLDPTTDEFEADGPQLDWKLPPDWYPAAWEGLWRNGTDVVARGQFFDGRSRKAGARFSYSATPASKFSSSWNNNNNNDTTTAGYPSYLRRFHVNTWEPPECAELRRRGVRTATLHHGTRLIPRINAPFEREAELAKYVQECRGHDVEIGTYFTIREISTSWSEFGLGTALFPDLATRAYNSREDGFAHAWSTALRDGSGDRDAAVAVDGGGAFSRYFVRAAERLHDCLGVAELYVDGFAAAPSIVRRLPATLRIDLHAANKTANYVELAPYVDSAWTGEANDYARGHAHFEAAIAAVGFGWPSQMLSGKVRKQPSLYFRALAYGMTERPGWFGPDPILAARRAAHLWRLFDFVSFTTRRQVRRLPCVLAAWTSPDRDVSLFVAAGFGPSLASSGACPVDLTSDALAHLLPTATPRDQLRIGFPHIPALQCAVHPAPLLSSSSLNKLRLNSIFLVAGPRFFRDLSADDFFNSDCVRGDSRAPHRSNSRRGTGGQRSRAPPRPPAGVGVGGGSPHHRARGRRRVGAPRPASRV